MLYAALFRPLEGNTVTLDAYLSRRMQGLEVGKKPTKGRFAGIQLVGEYWLQTPDPRVVVVFAAEEEGPLLELVAEWETLFDITVVPASSVPELM
jgi:hypothetical protein